jgi:glycosyltransferase involved in cell wall biosynthesis
VITAHQPSRASFIARAYQSLIKQTRQFEWIVQVDGMKQDVRISKEIINDSRVKIEFNYDHLGAANTRNLALARSEGEFIYSLDDDDQLFPNALKELREALEQSDLDSAVGLG